MNRLSQFVRQGAVYFQGNTLNAQLARSCIGTRGLISSVATSTTSSSTADASQRLSSSSPPSDYLTMLGSTISTCQSGVQQQSSSLHVHDRYTPHLVDLLFPQQVNPLLGSNPPRDSAGMSVPGFSSISSVAHAFPHMPRPFMNDVINDQNATEVTPAQRGEEGQRVPSLIAPAWAPSAPPLEAIKRQYKPSFIRRRRKHGFLSRVETKNGRNVLSRRMKKRRKVLTV